MGTRILSTINPFPYRLFEGDEGGGQGGDPPADQGGQGDPDPQGQGQQNPPADDPVAKAYEKLRDAEKERDALKAQLRKQMPESERLKAEHEELTKERDRLQKELTEVTIRAQGKELAREAGFRSPAVALDLLLFRGVDLSTDAKIKSALGELAKEDPGLITTPPASGGPVNPANGKEPVGTTGFNRAIRQAAGR